MSKQWYSAREDHYIFLIDKKKQVGHHYW